MNEFERNQENLANANKDIEDIISLPIDNFKKIDLRSNAPVNQLKAIAVKGITNGTNSAEVNAVRAQEEANERKESQQRKNEEFDRKTKERIRQQNIKESYENEVNNNYNLDEIKKSKKQSKKDYGNAEYVCDTMVEEKKKKNSLIDYKEKNIERANKNKTIEHEHLLKNKAGKISNKSERIPEEVNESNTKTKNVEKIPRFVSVDDMKIQYNPKMITKPKKNLTNSQNLNIKINEKIEIKNISSESDRNILEKSRYSAALKSLVRDTIKKKFPNNISVVCTCGALSHKQPLRFNTKCANNCPFYNRQQEYQKALKEILVSFKASE